jgi:hypothetical protein
MHWRALGTVKRNGTLAAIRKCTQLDMHVDARNINTLCIGDCPEAAQTSMHASSLTTSTKASQRSPGDLPQVVIDELHSGPRNICNHSVCNCADQVLVPAYDLTAFSRRNASTNGQAIPNLLPMVWFFLCEPQTSSHGPAS